MPACRCVFHRDASSHFRHCRTFSYNNLWTAYNINQCKVFTVFELKLMNLCRTECFLNFISALWMIGSQFVCVRSTSITQRFDFPRSPAKICCRRPGQLATVTSGRKRSYKNSCWSAVLFIEAKHRNPIERG